jgi:inward rectifier potassium channel
MTQRPNPNPPFAGLPVRRKGVDDSWWRRVPTDAYHAIRGLSWGMLTLLFFVVYLAMNLIFASILWFGDAQILNAGPSFADRFFFSVQTMATIGYGNLAPGDLLAHGVVTLESFVGVVYTAVVTGVFFAKFSTPSARVAFSRSCVVADIEGVPTLMFRCANARNTALVEATVTVTLTRNEVLEDGERVRRLYDLELRRNTSPMFALSWTVMHPIVPGSPLHGRSPAQVEAENVAILCTMTGIDDSLASTVHARASWGWRQVEWGRKFADMLSFGADGAAEIDFSVLDETRAAPLTATWPDQA